jgi:hypothetical protein
MYKNLYSTLWYLAFVIIVGIVIHPITYGKKEPLLILFTELYTLSNIQMYIIAIAITFVAKSVSRSRVVWQRDKARKNPEQS